MNRQFWHVVVNSVGEWHPNEPELGIRLDRSFTVGGADTPLPRTGQTFWLVDEETFDALIRPTE